jgi:dihydroorotate dehydrogenase electron transfer subunit
MRADRHAPLVRRERVGEHFVLLTFRHPEVARGAQAGQFVMIKAGSSPEPPLRRPFSISGVEPTRETFGIFVKEVGPGTRALSALRPGDTALCVGPLGRPFETPEDGSEALLVAGGYGVAPFLMLCRDLGRRGQPARVFYGGRTSTDLPMRSAFGEMGVPVVPTTEDGSLGRKGLVTVALEAHLDASQKRSSLLACGPDPMLRAVAALARRRGLRAQVSLDPWMGCGIGTCLGCVVQIQKTGEPRPSHRCACTEGPVFDAAVVVWPKGDA